MSQPSKHSPTIPHKEPAGGTATLEAAGAKKQTGLRKFFSLLGPGLITGASDDDPSGIATYSTAGASLGFSTLWTAPASLPLMATIQYICAKIGMVSGDGLGRVLRKHYSRWILYPAMLCLIVANTINAGADMGAIAAAFQLFVHVPTVLLLIAIAGVVMAFQIWGNYRLIANIFKWLTLALFAYIGAAFLSKPNLGDVLRGTFVPHLELNHAFLTTLVAILGTTISPYLFFWQASQEVEEEISAGRVTEQQREGATDEELKFAALDVNIGMLFANIVFYFVILATAATLHASGQTQIETATDAAKALEPIAGKGAFLLFALGIIGSGFLAVPVLTGSTGYAVCEALGWEHGLDKKPHHAKRFYAIIVACTLVGVAIDLIGINPMRALFLTAVLNGILAPPLLVIIMLVSNNKKVMGRQSRPLPLQPWLAFESPMPRTIGAGMFIEWWDAGHHKSCLVDLSSEHATLLARGLAFDLLRRPEGEWPEWFLSDDMRELRLIDLDGTGPLATVPPHEELLRNYARPRRFSTRR